MTHCLASRGAECDGLDSFPKLVVGDIESVTELRGGHSVDERVPVLQKDGNVAAVAPKFLIATADDWHEVVRDLVDRGLDHPPLVVVDVGSGSRPV